MEYIVELGNLIDRLNSIHFVQRKECYLIFSSQLICGILNFKVDEIYLNFRRITFEIISIFYIFYNKYD